MSSGLYAALSGATAKMQSLEVSANNLSNSGTPGYKKDQSDFEALFRREVQDGAGGGLNFVRISRTYTDFSQAELTATSNPLDLAIEGQGFFKLKGPDGFVYSRLGKFSVDAENRLVNPDGLPLVGEKDLPITVADRATVRIDEFGRISDAEGEVGVIPLFTSSDLPGLMKLGRGLFVAGPNSTELRVKDARIVAKHLENSNVQPLQEMTKMIDSLRAFEAYQKILKTYSTLSSKAHELGSIG
jgi:flagellar basal body rod protein FlgG